MRNKWLLPVVAAVLALEAGGMWALLLGLPARGAWPAGAVLLPAHVSAALVLAVALRALLPPAYRAAPGGDGAGSGPALLFLASVAGFIPLMGPLGLATFVLGALYFPKAGAPPAGPPLRTVAIAELPPQPRSPADLLAMSRGGLAGLLRHARDPEKRLGAVMATRLLLGREAIDLLRLALKDPVDDVRLLAYALIDVKEQQINARIRAALERLGEAGPAEAVALHARLVQEHWELTHVGLSTGDAEACMLRAARRHAEQVLSVRPADGAMHLLLGRILLRQGEPAAAAEALGKAVELGVAECKVAPYLAEVAFVRRRFAEVIRELGKLDPMGCRIQPALDAIRAYWLPGEAPRGKDHDR